MKYYTLPLLCLMFTLCATAQFNKGQKLIEGNLGFSISNGNALNSSGYLSNGTFISFSPTVGKFIKPNQLIGAGLSYSYNYYKYNYNGTDYEKQKINSSGVTIFSQKFITLAKNFFFTARANGSVSYQFGDLTRVPNTGANQTTKNQGYGISFSLSPGLSYRLTNRLLFDAYLNNFVYAGYNHVQSKYRDISGAEIKGTSDNFSLSSSLSYTSLGNIGFGFRYLLKNRIN